MPRNFYTQQYSSDVQTRRQTHMNPASMFMKKDNYNNMMSQKQMQIKRQQIKQQHKIQQQDIENALPLGQLTKKISKVASKMTMKLRSSKQTPTKRKPFSDITNMQLNSDSSSGEKTPKISKSFLEDDALTKQLNNSNASKTVKKTYNHAVVSYMHSTTFKKYQFSCFLEKDLNIPEKYEMKLIKHSIDNDIETDNDQIESAILNQSSSVNKAYDQHKVDFQKYQQEQELEQMLKEQQQQLNNNSSSNQENNNESFEIEL